MTEWHSLSTEEILKKFNSNESGLTNKEATKKLEEYGKNIIESGKKVSIFKLFLEQFTDSLVLMLIFASIFSFSIGKEIDGILIMAIVLANGLFGFIQNYNAEKSIESLKKLGAAKALVYRDGALIEISSENVVPGDILHLKEGTKIAADARIIESSEIGVDESILTGESV